MTNSIRGAVPFEVDGQSYTLRLGNNAQIRYEDLTGETALEAIAALLPKVLEEGAPEPTPQEMRAAERGQRKRVRRLFWAALSHMPEMTEEKAGDLMDAVGRRTFPLLMDAWRLSLPEAEPGNGGRAATKAAQPVALPEPDAA